MPNCVLLSRNIGGVPIDVILEEVHEASLEIARNPLEIGAEVTDHAYIMPKRLLLRGVTANQHAGLASFEISSTAGTIPRLSPPSEYLGNRRHADRAYAAATWQALVRLQEQREPFDVVTGLAIYRSMMIERLEAIRDEKSAHVLDFSCDLVEIIFADSGPAQLMFPPTGSPAAERSGVDNNGNQGQGTELETAEEEGVGSILHDLWAN